MDACHKNAVAFFMPIKSETCFTLNRHRPLLIMEGFKCLSFFLTPLKYNFNIIY